MEEEWKEIEGWSEYLISNLGRVYSVRNDLILKPNLAGDGYEQVHLSIKGQKLHVYVHHLVAVAFVDGYFERAEVNHKNGIKDDNIFLNIKWVTKSENIIHAYEMGLNPTRPVRIVETKEVFASASACARYIRGHQSAVWSCLNGDRRMHLGYTFEYVD